MEQPYSKRLSNIDIMRGLVMCIMALDHVRDLMHFSSITANPLDLNTTTPALFLTRWITHLCAPVFVFLSGSSAWLFAQKNGASETKKYLRTRGIWLIAVDLILVTLILSFDLRYRMILFEVVGAIGAGFLILSLLLRKNIRTIAWIGGAIVTLHGLLALIPPDSIPTLRTIIGPLFTISPIALGSDHLFLVSYPPIPWLAIMLLGFATGPAFTWPMEKRVKTFRMIGTIAIVSFLVIRAINIYGDQAPWSKQADLTHTILSFINISKYPPSLLFTILWLGIMMTKMSFLEGPLANRLSWLQVYGRVPLFYFLGHLLLIHLLTLGMLFYQGFDASAFDFSALRFGRPSAPSGIGLGTTYLIWIFVVVIMYPACKAFGNYKAAHPEKNWLRYL